MGNTLWLVVAQKNTKRTFSRKEMKQWVSIPFCTHLLQITSHIDQWQPFVMWLNSWIETYVILRICVCPHIRDFGWEGQFVFDTFHCEKSSAQILDRPAFYPHLDSTRTWQKPWFKRECSNTGKVMLHEVPSRIQEKNVSANANQETEAWSDDLLWKRTIKLATTAMCKSCCILDQNKAVFPAVPSCFWRVTMHSLPSFYSQEKYGVYVYSFLAKATTLLLAALHVLVCLLSFQC